MNRLDPIVACARAAHEANRVYCMALGDYSQVSWDDAPDWQKDSAIAGVRGVLEGNGPEASHKSWMAQKIADGWIYGASKNVQEKRHPCLVEYAHLPEEQKRKDDVFVSVVLAVALALGKTAKEAVE